MASLALALMASAAESKPLVIAHRGASGYLPEHTLVAKAYAHALGADYLEQDLVLTKDDVPVVLHDIHLDTVTDVAKKFPDRKRADGRYYALDFTLAEVKQLSVRERFNAKTGAPVYPKRYPSATAAAEFRIPTLEEELQLIQGLNRSTGRSVGIYPELKQPKWHRAQGHDLSRIVVPILHRYGYATKDDACFVQCFELAEVKRLRAELGWRGRLIMLLDAKAKSEDGTDHAALCTPAGLRELAGVVDGIGPRDDAAERRGPRRNSPTLSHSPMRRNSPCIPTRSAPTTCRRTVRRATRYMARCFARRTSMACLPISRM